MTLQFTKMAGCGNDYIYVDCRKSGLPTDIKQLSVRLSRRHFSIGADGIICICPPETPGAAAKMRIFNADGSEAKMCGNGIRCVAQWLVEHDPAYSASTQLLLDSQSGPKLMLRKSEMLWQVDMGYYSSEAAVIPTQHMGSGALVNVPLNVAGKTWQVTCINVGNPHCVTIVEDTAALDLAALGPAFEKHPNFPEQVNTEFIQVLSPTLLRMRVWERGSGETYACGTGTCAAVAAMTELGISPYDTDITVQLLGGELTIRVQKDHRVFMTGPAETIYEGRVEI